MPNFFCTLPFSQPSWNTDGRYGHQKLDYGDRLRTIGSTNHAALHAITLLQDFSGSRNHSALPTNRFDLKTPVRITISGEVDFSRELAKLKRVNLLVRVSIGKRVLYFMFTMHARVLIRCNEWHQLIDNAYS